MPLLPPNVLGPISECNQQLIVAGMLTGATVSIFSGQTQIGGGVASSGRQRFELNAPLTAGEGVHAGQEISGETSAPVPQNAWTEVQPAPSDLSSSFVHVDGIVYECGKCVLVSAAVPGATVNVVSGSGQRGTATAINGLAHITLSTATNSGEVLEIKQVACGIEGPSLVVPAEPDFPGLRLEQLPRPRLGSSLRACDRQVTVTRLVPGAQVVVTRSSGPIHSGCTGAGTLTFVGIPELQEGETVTAHQEFPDCGLMSDTTEVTVEAATPVPVPHILPWICSGASKIRVRNLRVGALIHVLVDGVPLGDAEAYETAQILQLPNSLPAGSQLTATQEVCGNVSEESEAVTVTESPADVGTPSIPGPLNACAPSVLVENLTLGAQLIIRDRNTGAPRSDSHFVSDNVAVMPVSPALMPGETLIASIERCGVFAESEPVTVDKPIEEFRPPRIESPVFEHSHRLQLLETIPGATVEVSIDDVWTTSTVCVRTSALIYVGDLPVGTSLRARQRICSTVSGESSRVVVRDEGPRITTESPLPDGEKGVPYSVTFAATGGVAPLKWDTTNGLVPGGLSLSSAGVLAGTPEFGGPYEFTVEAEDSGAPPVSDEKTFKLKMDQGTTETGTSKLDIWNCHSAGRPIRIWTADLTSATGWQEKSSSNVASQYTGSGTCGPDTGESPFTVELEDAHSYLLAIVDPESDMCPGNVNDPSAAQCLRLEAGPILGSDTGGVAQITVV
jgi:hypothetical protein